MAIVVSDTSPIRALAHLGLLELLAQLYGDVLVPPAVQGELATARARLPAVDVGRFPFIQVRAPLESSLVNQLRSELDARESEAIALAVEVKPDQLLIDETHGREVAARLGLPTVGVLGVLVLAKRAGIVAAVAPLMDPLITDIGFFIAPAIRATILKLAGE